MSPSASSPYDGSYETPFEFLDDALEAAHEFCAIYTFNCEVTIKLMSGTHYIFRGGQRDIYLPMN